MRFAQFLCWALCAVSAKGAETGGVLEEVRASQLGYVTTRWGIEDGLPLDRLTKLAQSPDGFLWIGTDEQGLVRFDGKNFVTLNPFNRTDFPGWTITGLLCDSHGRLWVSSHAFTSVKTDSHFRQVDWQNGGPVTETPNGNIYLQSRYQNDLRKIEGAEQVSLWRSEMEQPNGEEWATDVVEFDQWNRVWSVTANFNRLFEITSEGARIVHLPQSGEGVAWSFPCLLRLPDNLLAAMGRDGLYVCAEAGWVLSKKYPGSFRVQDGYRAAAIDSEGTIWIATLDNRILVWKADGQLHQVAADDIQRNASVRNILVDRTGTVWISTVTGLYRFRKAVFTSMIRDDWEISRVFDVVAAPNGDVWFAANRELHRIAKGASTSESFVGSGIYRGLLALSDDTLMGNYGRRSIYQVQLDSETSTMQQTELWQFPEGVYSILETARLGICVGTTRGVFRKEHEEFIEVFAEDGTSIEGVIGIVEGDGEELMVLTFLGELFRLNDNRRWESLLPVASGPIPNHAVGMTVSPSGAVWIAHRSAELRCYHNGRMLSFSNDQLNLPRGAMGIVSDLDGGLWWNTLSEGVFHLDHESAEALANSQIVSASTIKFGPQDGLSSLAGEGYYQKPVRDLQGRIWFPTSKGISHIDPRKWRTTRALAPIPEVIFDAVRFDGVLASRDMGMQGTIEVPTGVNRVEIDCSVADINSVEQSFLRYRLSGFHRDWVETRDISTISFQKLPPGEYELETQTANQFLRRSAIKAPLLIVVQPYWWERSWVRALAVLTLLGWGVMVYRNKVLGWERREAAQREYANRLIESQEAERTRIAGDLHDDVGQDLLVVKSRLDLSRTFGESNEDSRLRGELTGHITSIIEKIRGISHGLRPLQLERLGLTSSLQSTAHEWSIATGIHVKIEMDNIREELDFETAIGLYRIAQEALNNIVKHSDASEVQLILKRKDQLLCLTVKDDGRGFDVTKIMSEGSEAGHGIAGMEERCRWIGGLLTVESSPGKGTMIQAEVPLKQPFEKK